MPLDVTKGNRIPMVLFRLFWARFIILGAVVYKRTNNLIIFIKFLFRHLTYRLIGDPLTPPLLLLTKNVFTRCFCNNLYKEKPILGCFIVPPTSTICLKIQFLASYPHMRLLMGNPLTPPPLLLTNFITGCCCNIIFGEETISGCFHPIVPPSSAICLKIQFLAIYPYLRLLMGNPLTPTSPFIDKNIITGCYCNN